MKHYLRQIIKTNPGLFISLLIVTLLSITATIDSLFRGVNSSDFWVILVYFVLLITMTLLGKYMFRFVYLGFSILFLYWVAYMLYDNIDKIIYGYSAFNASPVIYSALILIATMMVLFISSFVAQNFHVPMATVFFKRIVAVFVIGFTMIALYRTISELVISLIPCQGSYAYGFCDNQTESMMLFPVTFQVQGLLLNLMSIVYLSSFFFIKPYFPLFGSIYI